MSSLELNHDIILFKACHHPDRMMSCFAAMQIGYQSYPENELKKGFYIAEYKKKQDEGSNDLTLPSSCFILVSKYLVTLKK